MANSSFRCVPTAPACVSSLRSEAWRSTRTARCGWSSHRSTCRVLAVKIHLPRSVVPRSREAYLPSRERRGVPAERIRERAGYLQVYRTVGIDRHAARRRHLSQSRAVPPHREELVAGRVAADRIAARPEQHGAGDLVGHQAEQLDSARGRAGEVEAAGGHPAVSRKVCELAQVAAELVDGEDLADPARVLAEGIGRRLEEHPAARDEGAAETGVGAA